MVSSLRLLPVLAVVAAWNAAAEPPIESLDPNMAIVEAESGLRWYKATDIGLEGQGWGDRQHPYDRFPARAEGYVPDPVWSLSQCSAGLLVRFQSDSPSVSARWSLRRDNLAMNHMAATGVSGLDLYVRDGGKWRWARVGRPEKKEGNTASLYNGPAENHEFLLYLPLYNAIEELEIGVAPDSWIAPGPAPADPRPVIIYGSSITQGGCASRPGMAYTAIVGRMLDRPVINLGFSGNGKMDPEVVDLMSEVDASVYVIDSIPNMNEEQVAERVEPLIRKLREVRPDTPILLVESITARNNWIGQGAESTTDRKNALQRAAFEKLAAEGVKRLTYLEGGHLLGDDEEGTVDGVHPTDLGFSRMAAAIGPAIEAALAQP